MKATVDRILSLSRVSLIRGGRPLIDDVSFTVVPASVVTLLGPNGAGKSLLLKLCHGLLTPDGGTVQWARGAAHSLVFQRPVFLRRSARDDILHALSLVEWPRPTRARRAARALVRFGLRDLCHHPARRLSGGEQQKLAIARAWAMKPSVLLLDEPTASLDLKATKELEDHIRRLCGEGVTIIMSTHDIAQARRLADQVLFISAGRLVEDTPAELFFRAPSSEHARRFLGGVLE